MTSVEHSGPIHLSFTYSESEYVSATRFYYSRRHHTKFNLYLGGAVFLAGLCFSALAADPYLGGLLFVLGLVLLALNYRAHFVMPRLLYRRNPQLGQPYELSFSEDGIHFRTSGAESRLEWSFYKKAWETPDFFFLIYGEDMFSLIPKRAFRDRSEVSAMRSLLRRKVSADVQTFGLSGGKPEESGEVYLPPAEPPDWR